MNSALIVDTDVLIDAGRGDVSAVARLQQEEQHATLAVSAITCMELFVGCGNKREQRQVERFLLRFQVVPVDSTISAMAVGLLKRYRLSHGLLIADALIAATCLTVVMPLLTKNQRDFQFIDGLVLPGYP